MAQDPSLQRVYCVWANNRYPSLRPVQEVHFDQSDHGAYSEVTPDLDYYINVSLKTKDGTWVDKEHEITELIADIANIALQISR